MTTGLVSLDPANRATLPTSLDQGLSVAYNDNPMGGSNPGAAIAYARRLMEASTNRKVIVLVGKNMPYSARHDPNPHYFTNRYQSTAVAEATAAGDDGIIVHTVTLGSPTSQVYGFNNNLAQEGGYSMSATDRTKLSDLLKNVLTMEVGNPRLVLR